MPYGRELPIVYSFVVIISTGWKIGVEDINFWNKDYNNMMYDLIKVISMAV